MMGTSTVLFVLALAFGVLAALFFKEGWDAGRRPILHDGIGAKDTDNLIQGCLMPIIGICLGFCATVIAIVAVGFMVAGR